MERAVCVGRPEYDEGDVGCRGDSLVMNSVRPSRYRYVLFDRLLDMKMLLGARRAENPGRSRCCIVAVRLGSLKILCQ